MIARVNCERWAMIYEDGEIEVLHREMTQRDLENSERVARRYNSGTRLARVRVTEIVEPSAPTQGAA